MTGETLSPPTIAISSCLLGQNVRYDGTHKYHNDINQVVARFVRWMPVCPEVGIGLGVPRPTLQLRAMAQTIRVCGVDNPDVDVTDKLHDYAESLAAQLAQCSGYILKDRSPSCGLQQVPVYDARGVVVGEGDGGFAAILRQLLPGMPLIGEAALKEPRQRDVFFTRVFVYQRWQLQGGFKMGYAELLNFHQRHKFLIQAHDETRYRQLGRLLATPNPAGTTHTYLTLLMQALAQGSSVGRHCNVLQHLAGFFKHQLASSDKVEFLDTLAAYRGGEVDLAAPLGLIRRYQQRFPHSYIAQQYYVYPHPNELALRTNTQTQSQ